MLRSIRVLSRSHERPPKTTRQSGTSHRGDVISSSSPRLSSAVIDKLVKRSQAADLPGHTGSDKESGPRQAKNPRANYKNDR
ncbi:hypothetical protein RRG08_042995 [Elysia crispata]|uniref:Uncharacterized protein n=1 Tax=Elysia crispata TaxID=231223 RepID=A0AAE0XY15_9GAST|nr:hypothetical protein RRG08_042995 [Elysia crispata]